jgi:anthranilate/para-aminobenzoate synthase component II
MRVLMVDNYDSFTYNLVHLLEAFGAEVIVRRSDEISLEEARELAPDRLVVSPGPGRPTGAGRSLELILGLGETTSTLGLCLGHQAIVEASDTRPRARRRSCTGRRARSSTTDAGSSRDFRPRSRLAATTPSRPSPFPTSST